MAIRSMPARGALAGVILVGLLVTPALGVPDLGDVANVYILGDFVSGHVYQGNPGDYSRPVSAVRVLIGPFDRTRELLSGQYHFRQIHG